MGAYDGKTTSPGHTTGRAQRAHLNTRRTPTLRPVLGQPKPRGGPGVSLPYDLAPSR